MKTLKQILTEKLNWITVEEISYDIEQAVKEWLEQKRQYYINNPEKWTTEVEFIDELLEELATTSFFIV